MELMKKFDRKGVLKLATDKLTIPYHARTCLRRDLHSAFDSLGLPTGFIDVIKARNAVVSGSFVPAFMDPNFCDTWGGMPYIPSDVDVYVAKNELESTLVSFNDLQGANMVVLSSATRPTDAEEDLIPGIRDAAFYNNAAIDAITRIRLDNETGKRCFVDVIESKSASPFMPVLLFDLSHLRVAITAHGFFEFHPEWHNENKSYAGPKVHTLTDDQHLLPHTRAFFTKYERRGLHIVDSEPFQTPQSGHHVCYSSTICPLTLRSTLDEGVRFVPCTEDAAIQAATSVPPILQDPIVYWRHGGKCAGTPGAWEDPVIFDSNNMPVEENAVV